MLRPCREGRQETDDEIGESYRRETVDELVLEIDVEGYACVHTC